MWCDINAKGRGGENRLVVKAIVKVYAKEGMTREEFVTNWLTKIVPAVKQVPGLKKYVINIVVMALGEEPGYQGTAELWWDSMKEMQNAEASPEMKNAEAVLASCVRKITTLVTEEHVII